MSSDTENVKIDGDKVEKNEGVEKNKDVGDIIKIEEEKSEEKVEKLIEKNSLYLITIDDENVGIFEDLKNAEKYVIEFSECFARDPQCYIVKVLNNDDSIITHKVMGYSFNFLFNYDKVISTICIHKVPKLIYE